MVVMIIVRNNSFYSNYYDSNNIPLQIRTTNANVGIIIQH